MRSTLRIVRFIIMVITGVSGTLLNTIIIVLNFRFWRDVTISGSYNKILFIIGLTNILLQGNLIFDTIFETFGLYLSDNSLFLWMFTLDFTLIGINTWNTTWLSMFCCVRLVNSSQCFFSKIKAKFFSSLPQLILGSILVSVTINFPLFWTTILNDLQNTTECPMSGKRISMDYYCIIFSSIFGFTLPFSMTCVSIGLCLASLLRHINRMGRSDSHLTSAQLQGHYRAVRTMVIRVSVDFFFFLTTVIGTSNPSFLNSLAYSVLWISVLTYPTFQAFILIFGNPKLKSAAYSLIKALR